MTITINKLDEIINTIESLKESQKQYIFEKAFISCDTKTLSKSEQESILKALKEHENGETVLWKNGK